MATDTDNTRKYFSHTQFRGDKILVDGKSDISDQLSSKQEASERKELVVNLSTLELPDNQEQTIVIRDEERSSKRRATHEDLERLVLHLLTTVRNQNEEVIA